MDKYFISVLKNHYFDFNGRARRKEFWMFSLWCFLIALVTAIIDIILGFNGGGPITALFALAIIIPSLGLTVRRLHDINYSGWWYFISFIPLIGGLILLWFCIKEGDKGPNQYGPDPKAESIPEQQA